MEINSTFQRPHRASTFARWAASVPATFRFSLKVPKAITHELRLADALGPLDAFLDAATHLGDRLGCLLVQLPPSLAWDAPVAMRFLAALRERFAGGIALEPRHASWFAMEPAEVLTGLRIARVAADPPPTDSAFEPGGWSGLAYFRLHGAPRIYYSSYDDAALQALAARVRVLSEEGTECWCIFDNTVLGAAAANAIALQEAVLAAA